MFKAILAIITLFSHCIILICNGIVHFIIIITIIIHF